MSTTVDLGKITASVTVGTTTTGAAGTNASVTNSGTTQDAVLNFTIPRGEQGVQGPQGSTGPQGPQGNSGYTGAAGELEVVNNLTDGGATAALSAEMGKVLSQNVAEISSDTIESTSLRWTQGVLNVLTGAIVTSTTRCYVALPIVGRNRTIRCSVNSGYYVHSVVEYSTSSISTSTFVSGNATGDTSLRNYSITSSYYVVFVVAKSGNTTISAAEATNNTVIEQEHGDLNLNALNNLQGAGLITDAHIGGWAIGTIDSSGAIVTSSTHLRSAYIENTGIIELYAGESLYIESVFIFNGNTLSSTIAYGQSLERCRYTVESGYRVRVVIKRRDGAAMTTSMGDLLIASVVETNSRIFNVEETVANTQNEIMATNNLVENISGGGVSVSLLPFGQGFINQTGYLNNLATRVSTDFIDATESSLILKATGNYRIRNGNRYDANGVNLGQILQADLLEEYELPMGYKYRMTFCDKDDLSASITPAMVEPYVTLETPSKRQIVVKVNEISGKVAVLEEQKKNEGNYLISDYFNENNYNPNNYSNFSAANLSSGHYNIASGWANTLKMSKVVSFQDFAFEFDVNVTNNTEKIVVATEVTENVVASVYGSCAYIDLNASKMYLLQPKLYNDSNQPNVSNKRVEIALTNITSSGHRYIVSFGKKDRNLFVKFRNYYTNEIVELTCTDANNTSLAGSGYDKIRVGSMSGAISLNSIVGSTKTNVDVLFVGDSITDGRNIPLADSWAYRLGEYLTDNYLIAARAGGQIQQVIDFLAAYGQIINPKVIIASVGVNGGNTTAKFLELFELIESLNAIPVINTIYNVSSSFSNINSTEWNTMNSYILSLPCKHIRFDIASSANKYSPVFNTLDSSYTLTDSVHPDSGGSDLLYQRALADLSQLKGGVLG